MTPEQRQRLTMFVRSNCAHECGHMTVQFKAGRLARLRYLPHEEAADGVPGVLETKTPTDLNKGDCVALAAGMVGELVALGKYDPERSLDDRNQVQRLAGQPLENFTREANDILQQNLLFFRLLNEEVRPKMFDLLASALFIPEYKKAELPDEITIFTLTEVEEVYKRAELILASTGKPTGSA
jgi:hypothetical protein